MLVVLLECIIIELPKVGGAIAPLAPPVPLSLITESKTGRTENILLGVTEYI